MTALLCWLLGAAAVAALLARGCRTVARRRLDGDVLAQTELHDRQRRALDPRRVRRG
jgi:hypothetical protein